MARQYKCPICNEQGQEENMIIETINSVKRRIHKGDCHDGFIKDQEFKKKESKEWDNCYNTIKDVCEVELIPPSFIGLIQRLRNGNPVIGMKKDDVRHFKQGFSYTVIQQAFLEKADLIRWKKQSWNGSNGRFLTFVLVYYIMDIIENVHEDMLKKKKEAKRAQQVVIDADFDLTGYQNRNNHASNDDEMDISKFL